MDTNVLLSKIVANPTETTWAQVYSTINLYVALSIKSETQEAEAETSKKDTTIAADGKELLERLQREYFSLDSKSLENIKQSVEAAIKDIDPKNASIVLANITGEVLYIVVLHANVILRRNGKVAIIATGSPGVVEAYSGKIQADDTIILETAGFGEKITLDKLSETLDHLDVSEISENLAPLVHQEPAGTEAAIILQYKKLGGVKMEVDTQEPEATPAEHAEEIEEKTESTTLSDLTWEKDAPKNDVSEADDPISHLADNGKKPDQKSSQKFFSADRKIIIVVVIILLVALFAGSIYYEKDREKKASENAALTQILDPAQKKFDEANALVSLNKGLALDEFTDIKKSLAEDENKLPAGTDARKKLDEFAAKVDQKVNELGAGSTLNNQKQIFSSSAYVTLRNKQLYSVDTNGKISLLDSDGNSTKQIDSKNKNPKAIGANDTDAFVAGDSGITDGTKVVVKKPGGIASLDTFGSNLYALNSDDKTVDKYPTGSFSKSTYFTESVTLNKPTSMTIDASIWILDNGKIRKFTKGKEDSFTVTGLTKDISTDALITTDVDDANIYVLDPANTRIVAISKDGSVKNQYISKDLANATSFAVDEPNKKMFVIISGKLFSFDL